MDVRFQLLGPPEAWVGEQQLVLGGRKPRALLAALLLEHGRVVPTTRLIEVVWGEEPPDTATAVIRGYVSSLRQVFAGHGHPDVIETRSPGYLARIPAGSLDRDEFVRLVGQAREVAAQQAAPLLHTALALWRGPALAGLEDTLLAGEAARLEEVRLAALEDRISADLALGRHDEVVPELAALVRRHPVNERLRGRFMVALYRQGRQSDALATFRECRDALREELGADPGDELTELHQGILRGRLPGAVGSTAASPAPAVVDQLPAAPLEFTGRAAERTRLFELGTAGGIAVISGQGGVGKSALALRVAHDLREAFPDGRLYGELHGMADVAAEPGQVLGGFLSALGVPGGQVPESAHARAQLFRRLMADRRMLVVLDDAAAESQVRDLLPGAAGCAVLITSRDRLAGLAGARLVELSVLAQDEAAALLTRLVGTERVDADRSSAVRIVVHCDRLPLGIRIAAARLVKRQRLPLSWLADRLADESQRLGELSGGDMGIRASVALSCRGLDERQRLMLGRLGFLGVPDFATWMVGWLTGLTASDAEDGLEQLVDAQLVEFVGVDPLGALRYRLHDLVRLYARELAEAGEPVPVLVDAVAQVLHGWRAVVRRESAQTPPDDIRWHHDLPAPPPMELPEIADARAWFEAERVALVSGVERAAALGLYEIASTFAPEQYSSVLSGVSRFELRTRLIESVLAAARAAGDRRVEAYMLTDLGQLRYLQDRFDEARVLQREALGLFRQLGDRRGQAAALAGLGAACREPGHLVEALHFLDQASDLLLALEDEIGVAHARRLSGAVRLEMGRFAQARSDLDESLSCYRRAASSRGEALVLRTLSLYHRALGDLDAAVTHAEAAHGIFRELGDEFLAAYAVRALAKARLRQGVTDEARTQLHWALSISEAHADRWGEGATLRVLGQLHLARAEFELAEQFLRAAIKLWDAMDTPLWRARTEYDLSLVRAARGDIEGAGRLREGALKVLHDHGAREYAEVTGLCNGG